MLKCTRLDQLYTVATTLGKNIMYRMNRLVWSTFNDGPILPGYVIDHVNGNYDDDHVDDLECVTVSENNRRGAAMKKGGQQQRRIYLKYILQITKMEDINTRTYYGLKTKNHTHWIYGCCFSLHWLHFSFFYKCHSSLWSSLV
jgi:hypothetical protein